jgi:hypothetical protein
MAKIHLSIEADSIEGLHDCLRNLLNGVYEVNTALPSQEWVYESAPDVIGTDTMPAPEKPKRGRKPKATTPEGQPEPATSPGDSVPPVVVAPELPAAAASAPVQPVSAPGAQDAVAAAPNSEDVRAALKGVIAKGGQRAAIDLLRPFGTTRFSDLKPEQYAEVIRACV